MNVVIWNTGRSGYDKYTVLAGDKLYAFNEDKSEKGYEVECFDADFMDATWMEAHYHRVHVNTVPNGLFDAIREKQKEMDEAHERELRVSTALEFARSHKSA